jgi:hypothetical protein
MNFILWGQRTCVVNNWEYKLLSNPNRSVWANVITSQNLRDHKDTLPIYMISIRNLDSYIIFTEFRISIYVLIIQLLFHIYL